MRRWDPVFGATWTEGQKADFLGRLKAGQTINNALDDLNLSKYSLDRERRDDPAFGERVRTARNYPLGVCNLTLFNRVLSDGVDAVQAAVAYIRIENARKYQSLSMKLKSKEFELKAAAFRHMQGESGQPGIDLMQLTLDEIKELEAINNVAGNGDEPTDKEKVRWFDLLRKASLQVDGQARKMLGNNDGVDGRGGP
jgi:hypothetical protein